MKVQAVANSNIAKLEAQYLGERKTLHATTFR